MRSLFVFTAVVFVITAGCSTQAPPTVPAALEDAAEIPRSPAWDTDGDLLADAWEVLHCCEGQTFAETQGLSPWEDMDGDGLPTILEYGWGRPASWDEARDGAWENGTHPRLWDTDRDGLPDGYEAYVGLDPLVNAQDPRGRADSDGDGLSDEDEYAFGRPLSWFEPHNGLWTNGTDPTRADTDGDGLPDGHEISWYGQSISDPRTPDSDLDFDRDGLSNLAEFQLGTDLDRPDHEEDGLPDGVEVHEEEPGVYRLVSDPRSHDTDGDVFPDDLETTFWRGWYAARGTNGSLEELRYRLTTTDSDGDGLHDGTEHFALGTDPGLWDTDGDGFSDLVEVGCGADPTDEADICGMTATIGIGMDSDGDGLSDAFERSTSGTDPFVNDSDGDWILDGAEWRAWGRAHRFEDFDGDGTPSNLVDPDSDGDGLPDGVEFGELLLPRSVFFHASPRHNDTDGDSLLDGEEATNLLSGDPSRCDSSVRRIQPRSWSPEGSFESRDGCFVIKGAYGILLYPVSDEAHVRALRA